jgi:uncharacterized protein (DUF4415 family)
MKKRAPTVERDTMPGDVSHLPGWARGEKVADPNKVKLPTRRITINLDADIVAIFKAEALRGGPPYQVAINWALRRFLIEKEKDAKQNAVETILAALDDPVVSRKIRDLASRRVRARSSR